MDKSGTGENIPGENTSSNKKLSNLNYFHQTSQHIKDTCMVCPFHGTSIKKKYFTPDFTPDLSILIDTKTGPTCFTVFSNPSRKTNTGSGHEVTAGAISTITYLLTRRTVPSSWTC